MKSENVKLSSLIPVEKYRISIPPDPGLHEVFVDRFPGIPPLVVNGRREIISGYDSYDFHIGENTPETDVLFTQLEVKDALFLACNARAVIRPLSLLEKLNFISHIAEYSDIPEIYKRTDMGIRIDETLLKSLPDLLDHPFLGLLGSDRLSLKTAKRMLALNSSDREVLAALFSTVRFSVSNELNLIDMITEICFRDKVSAAELLKSMGANPTGGEEDAGRAILTELYRLRYPSYTEAEEKWTVEAGKIKVPYRHTIHHSPFFEKKGVELKLFLESLDEIRDISEKLSG